MVVQVVVGALVQEGRVLLAHRRPDKHAFPDVWDLPGGVMEAGESESDALVRELHEELGVRISTESTSHLCRVTVSPEHGQAVLSAWLVHEWEGVPANVAPEEHVAVGWFAPDDVPPLVDPRVRAAVLQAMGAG